MSRRRRIPTPPEQPRLVFPTHRHVVCFSGGHSSALVAIEVVRRYGAADVVLLNHDIHPRAEDRDVKRFKVDVAAHLGLPITYASHPRCEVGIEPPLTYGQWKHANCVGCLKAGWQHWYVVFCTRPDMWERGKAAEDDIGYTIHADGSLADREPMFAAMRAAGIVATEHTPSGEFWSSARKAVRALPVLAEERDARPCECVFRKPRRGQRWQPQCDCEALPGEGHALHCARVFGNERVAA